MWILRLAFRNALRNVRRSLLTAATVIIGVALFVIFLTYLEGASKMMFEETTKYIGHAPIADTDFIERENLRPMYEYIPDAQAVVDAALAEEGVTDAFAVIESGVAISAGDELGDVFGMATGSQEGWYERIGLEDNLAEGVMPTGPGEWLMGSKLVEKAEASLGDEIILFGSTQDGSLSPLKGELVGVIHSGAALTDRSVYLSLEEMQFMVDIEGGAIQVLLYTDDTMNAHEPAAALQASPVMEGLTAQAWSSREPYNQIVPMMDVIQGILAGALVFLTALAIWNTMTMSVMERTAEIGVMRAMGLSRFGAVGMFVVEAGAIALLGGILGVLLGAGPAWYLETTGITFGEDIADQMGTDYAITSTMYGDFTAGIAVRGVILGIVMAVVGSFIPSLRAAAVQPVEAMRHGR